MAGSRRFFGLGTIPSQRGYPMPLAVDESRAAAGRPFSNTPPFGGYIGVLPKRSDLGAAGQVNNFGQIFVNPIGAGIYAPNRTQASYGMSGQYVDHAVWWASQIVPTTIPFQSLTSPQQLLDLLGEVNVQAVARIY